MRTKKAEWDGVGIVIFISVFVTVMAILGSIFLEPIIEKKVSTHEDSFTLDILGAISNTLENIPVIGDFWNIIKYNFIFIYIHPYLAMIYGAIIGAPLGYLLLKLARGGG